MASTPNNAYKLLAGLVIGLVERVYVRDGVINPETLLVNPGAFRPIGRMEVPSEYCRTNDCFDMPRPE